MKQLFDDVSFACSRNVTAAYSTSFSKAVGLLAPSIQPAIHSIYGFVRFADEIVDTFHDYDKEALLDRFESDLLSALEMRISLNPILNAFQQTVLKYNIDRSLIDAFMKSMRKDLSVDSYETEHEYNEYIYGSADVVGLMCLKVFVKGNEEAYEKLKNPAMRLGSAFQKVNFLRDIKNDVELLNRQYFPHADLRQLNNADKERIIQEIEDDFTHAYEGIRQLPKEARLGVYTAYVYYRRLLGKLKRTPSARLMESRIRVSDYTKIGLMAKSYLNTKLNLL